MGTIILGEDPERPANPWITGSWLSFLLLLAGAGQAEPTEVSQTAVNIITPNRPIAQTQTFICSSYRQVQLLVTKARTRADVTGLVTEAVGSLVDVTADDRTINRQ